jgi:prophage regulatory protein
MPQKQSQLPAHSPVLPDEGFLRLWQIIGCKRRGVPPLLPMSESGWHRKQAEGVFPKGIRISARTRVYPVAEIRQLIADLKAQGGPDLRKTRYQRAGRKNAVVAK